MDVVLRIKELCAKIGVSPTKMLRDLGFSTGLLSQWNKGSQRPSNEKVKAIADYLEVPTDYLINGTPYPKNAYPADLTDRTAVMFWGKVSAGPGAYAEGIPVRAMAADNEDLQDGYEYAWLEVEGDSMYPDLQDGDYILVRIQNTAESGDLVVALISDGCETNGYVKRINIVENHHLSLISKNPSYNPMIFIGDDMNKVRIFGVVVSSKRVWK